MQGAEVSTPKWFRDGRGTYRITGCVVRGITYQIKYAAVAGDEEDPDTGVAVLNIGTINTGALVQFDPNRSTFEYWRQGTKPTDDVRTIQICGYLGAGDTPCQILGVALEEIPFGSTGEVAGPGSIVPVQWSGTQNLSPVDSYYVVGDIPSGFAKESATAIVGHTVGTLIRPAGTITGTTGVSNMAIILVNPQ